MKDWYNIKRIDFLNHEGSGLLVKYDGSPYKVIKSIIMNIIG
jgi:hypothetical protein